MVSMLVTALPKAKLCFLTTSLTDVLSVLFSLSCYPPCCLTLFLFPPWPLLNPESPNKVRNSFHHLCSNYQIHTGVQSFMRGQITDALTAEHHALDHQIVTWHKPQQSLQCTDIALWLRVRHLIRFSTSDRRVKISHKTCSSTDDNINQVLMDSPFTWCVCYSTLFITLSHFTFYNLQIFSGYQMASLTFWRYFWISGLVHLDILPECLLKKYFITFQQHILTSQTALYTNRLTRLKKSISRKGQLLKVSHAWIKVQWIYWPAWSWILGFEFAVYTNMHFILASESTAPQSSNEIL